MNQPGHIGINSLQSAPIGEVTYTMLFIAVVIRLLLAAYKLFDLIYRESAQPSNNIYTKQVNISIFRSY